MSNYKKVYDQTIVGLRDSLDAIPDDAIVTNKALAFLVPSLNNFLLTTGELLVRGWFRAYLSARKELYLHEDGAVEKLFMEAVWPLALDKNEKEGASGLHNWLWETASLVMIAPAVIAPSETNRLNLLSNDLSQALSLVVQTQQTEGRILIAAFQDPEGPAAPEALSLFIFSQDGTPPVWVRFAGYFGAFTEIQKEMGNAVMEGSQALGAASIDVAKAIGGALGATVEQIAKTTGEAVGNLFEGFAKAAGSFGTFLFLGFGALAAYYLLRK